MRVISSLCHRIPSLSLGKNGEPILARTTRFREFTVEGRVSNPPFRLCGVHRHRMLDFGAAVNTCNKVGLTGKTSVSQYMRLF